MERIADPRKDVNRFEGETGSVLIESAHFAML